MQLYSVFALKGQLYLSIGQRPMNEKSGDKVNNALDSFMLPNSRWKHRFQNFTKAINRLEEALLLPNLDDLALNGLIQRFEYTFELAWKTLKDFLEEQNFTVASPRDTIRQGVASNYIADAQTWLDALNHRNLLSHMYDEEHFREAEQHIRARYFQAIKNLYIFLQSQL